MNYLKTVLVSFVAAVGIVAMVDAVPTFVVKNAGGSSSVPVSTNNILYYYRLDEASTAWADATAQLGDLTVFSGSPSSYAGKITNAIGIDNTKTQFLRSASSTVGNITNGNHTLTYWAYSSNSSANVTVMKGYGMGGGYNSSILQSGGTNYWAFSLIGTNGMGIPTTYSVFSTNGGVPSSNTWYFVCAQFCRASNYIAISVNNSGLETNSFPSTAAPPTGTAFRLHIGAAEVLAPPGFNGQWPGMIDEVAFFSRNLSLGEVTSLYNNGSPGKAQTYPFTP